MTLIFGPDGNPISSAQYQEAPNQARAAPMLPGGSADLPGLGGFGALAPAHLAGPGWAFTDQVSAASRYGASRDQARRLCRTLYFLPNPLFRGAVQLVTAFLSGDDFTYAPHEDRLVDRAVEEFWQANSLGELFTFRFLTELFLDGENATVFPTGHDDPGARGPARIAMLDVEQVTVEGDTRRGAVASDMASRISLSTGPAQSLDWNAGEFVWTAYDALYNDVRGWPIAIGAAHAAVGYVAMANNRLNLHEVQQRIIAVYTAALNPAGTRPDGSPDGGLSQWRAKTGAFSQIPERGGVFPLVTSPGFKDKEGNTYSGFTEKLEFPSPSSGATDAATDQRTFLRMVGLAMGGLPEHWLGEGSNATRSTAGEMNTPAVRLAQQRQAIGRGWLDRLIRTELKRRYGPDQLYTVYTYEGQGVTRKRKKKRVPADLIEINWNLPSITEELLADLITRADRAAAHNWASPETLSSSLGFDPGVEESRLGSRGLSFGTASTPAAPTGGTASANPADQTPTPA